MKTKIVDKKEIRKSSAVREAEKLLHNLSSDQAVEVLLEDTSARTIRRTFSKAAANLGLAIEVLTRDDRVYVLLKEPTGSIDAIIRRALDKSAEELVTEAELVQLTVLDGYKKDIMDLGGIEDCTGLTTLYLGKNKIDDISLLACQQQSKIDPLYHNLAVEN